MGNHQRKINADDPIIWTGDLLDDCTAKWCGLMLRAEWMDEDYWWWRVYDMQRGEAIIDDSNNTDERFIGGEAARERAESVAKQYINTISGKVAGKFFILDTFKLTGRGPVFVGIIKEGLILSGNTIEFFTGNRVWHRKINGVDAGLRSASGEIKAGLLINCKNENEVDELKGLNPANQVATVYE
jgi:hypothetical protein